MGRKTGRKWPYILC